MAYIYNEQHWNNFLITAHNHQDIIGKNPRSFATSVGGLPPNLLEKLPNHTLCRNDLFEILEHEKDNRVIFLSIMAWGSMKIPHARRSLEHLDLISKWIDFIRYKNPMRQDAYDSFLKIGANGIGPAYFTKLIFFLTARKDNIPTGYIMDQWTAKSVNLIINGFQQRNIIYEGSFVNLTNQGYVYAKNESIQYEHFCRIIDEIGIQLEENNINNIHNQPWGELAEEKLFSKGGRNPMPWRIYVRNNWKAGANKITLDQIKLMN